MPPRGASESRGGGAALLAIALALLVAAALIVWQLLSMQQGASPSPSPDAQAEQDADGDGFPDVDWAYWQSVNQDVIGWITIPGTAIDYPIVQASEDDPEYYLYHDVYGGYNVYGVPYLDASCAETGLLHSRNAMVFGHHMDDGSMFAALAEYSDEPYAAEHAEILVQTPTEKARLQVRLVRVVSGSSGKRTEFLDATDYRIWYAEQVEGATVALDGSTDAPSRLVTLVTCSYLHANDRTLVLAS